MTITIALLIVAALWASGCATTIHVLRTGIADSARAVKAADEALAAAYPIMAEKVRRELETSGCESMPECMEWYRDRMDALSRAIAANRAALDMLAALESAVDVYETLDGQAQYQKMPVLIRQLSQLVDKLVDILDDLRRAGVNSPSEVKMAVSMMKDLLDELKRRTER